MSLRDIRFNNKNGFSLVEVAIAAAVASGLGLALTQMAVNLTKASSLMSASLEETNVISGMRMILESEKHCRISLAGEGDLGSPTSPVRLRKSTIDNGGSFINLASSYTASGEGLDVALWYSDPGGTRRAEKQFNGANNPGGDDRSHLGKIRINNMKLVLPGGDFANSADFNNEPAQLVVFYTLNNAGRSTAKRKIINFAISGATDGAGRSTIYSCGITNTATSVINIGGGCPNPSRWYCACAARYTGDREGHVYGCVHCNADSEIDDFWLYDFHITHGQSDCGGSPNPPGPDPVHRYRVDRW